MEILHGLDVFADVLISSRQTLLDIFVNIDTLDDFHFKAGLSDFVAERKNLIQGPDLSDRNM